MSRAFAELDTVMEPEMQAVAKAKAEAHVAEVMAAVDVDKFLKARARLGRPKQLGATRCVGSRECAATTRLLCRGTLIALWQASL